MSILFYIALMILSGLIFGRAVKLIKLPNVTGYLLAGLFIGPHILNIIPDDIVGQLGVVSEVALAFIAFSIGSEFKIDYIKKVGTSSIIIALCEALVAALLVFGVLVAFGFGIEISLLLGAIASATAPAATIMVIKQYNAKGSVTDMLLSVVAIDDVIAIMAFSLATAIVNSIKDPNSSAVMAVFKPLIEIFGSIILGFIIGIVFNIVLKFFKKESNRIIITVGFVFLGAALASILGFSALLLCMSMGATLININKSGVSVFKLSDYITPPIFLLFFVLSGAELDITILPKIGLIGILYLAARVIGKIAGASVGAIVAKSPKTTRKYLGFSLIPQAGVAIGLSLIASQIMPEYGQTIRAVILSATLIYELIGPAMTKLALRKAGEI